MMEDFVTYEQAVKLKELGFDWECNGIYKYHSSKIIHKLPKNPHKRKSIKKAIEKYPIITFLKKSTEIEYKDDSWINSYYLDEYKYIDAPTLAQAQKWFREKYNLFVHVYLHLDDCWRYEIQCIFNYDNFMYEPEDGQWWRSYEEALSAGIDKALELLKEESNGNQD